MNTARPLGVYIHVPFCRVHCPYCDFYTYPAVRNRDTEFARALLQEIELSRHRLNLGRHEVSTVYFGGGTPSLLADQQIRAILQSLGETFSLSASAEVTLEVNPEDLSPGRLDTLRALGINRFSLGLQSFRQDVLDQLGRPHTIAQVWSAPEQLSGADNWNADLIFGWAGQSVSDLDAELDELLACEPDHVSLYQLTIGPRTRFGVLAAQGRLEVAGQESQAELYLAAVARLEAHGLHQYEVSNFAREGAQSQHNLACWRRQPYIGLGPSACSQLWSRRTENIRSLPGYLRRLARGDIPVTFVEVLSPDIVHTEKIWLGLRTSEGVPRDLFANSSQSILDEFVDAKLAVNRPDCSYALSPKGMAMADDIVLRVLQTETHTNFIPRHLDY